MSSAISYTWTLASELSGCRIVMTCNPRYNCCSVSQHVDIGSKASDSILVPSGDAQGCSSIKRCRSCHWQFLLDVLLVCYIDCKHSECKKLQGLISVEQFGRKIVPLLLSVSDLKGLSGRNTQKVNDLFSSCIGSLILLRCIPSCFSGWNFIGLSFKNCNDLQFTRLTGNENLYCVGNVC